MGAESNMVTTVIGFGMSVVFTVFICMKLICGWLCRGASSRSRSAFEFDDAPISDVEQGWQPRHRFNGLEPVLVAEIPTIKFSQDTFCVEDATCTICLGEYQEKEILRIMPKCGHIFHLACIDTWLRKQSSCPVCRLPLRDSFKPKDHHHHVHDAPRPQLLPPALATTHHQHHHSEQVDQQVEEEEEEEEGSNTRNNESPADCITELAAPTNRPPETSRI